MSHSSDYADAMATPTVPSSTFLDQTTSGISARIESAYAQDRASRDPVEAYGGQFQMWGQAEETAESFTSIMEDIVHDLHAHPETAFEEFRSQRQLVSVLRERGFVVETGAYGVSTSFKTEAATSHFDPDLHPTIVIMAEYDALPGIGHACGHNIIAAAGVGAFLTAAKMLEHLPADAQGRVVLQGTPAEEGHTGKEYMIRGGSLEGVDAAIMIHGFGYDISSHAWVGRRSVTAHFHGVAAHASSQPFMGRNALDAATLAYQGIGLLRQQMPPSDRLHSIISDGGQRPSIIPESAELQIYVRSLGTRTLVELSERVNDVIYGAAQMAGCGVEVEWDPHPMSLPVRNNQVLARRWAVSQKRRGRIALPAGTVPESLAASTDFGNVSQRVPGIHPMVKVSPSSVALHTEEFARWANTKEAVEAAVDSAASLSHIALDLLADPRLLARAREEFDNAGGVVTVEGLLAESES
ncbi:MAG: M20 family metallopeptidase [Corynebacterium sp.]|nr:M20 family metallopeptidase [Corynebacterium sp.]